MKKKWSIDIIALENEELINKGRDIRLFGIITICIGVMSIMVGERITNNSSLKIKACNNEAADLIDELGCIYAEYAKK